MLKFESKDLELKITAAFKFLSEKFFEDFVEDFYFNVDELLNNDYDPNDFDDMTIKEDTEIGLGLPRVDEAKYVTVKEFLELIDELKTSRLIDNLFCISSKRVLIRVESNYFNSIRLINEMPYYSERYEKVSLFEIKSILEGEELSISLTRGFSIFGILVAINGEYEKFFPPVTEDDLFIEIRFKKTLSEKQIKEIANAYIFELSSSVGIDLYFSPRPSLESYYDEEDEDKEKEFNFDRVLLRPLMISKGMDDVISLYIRALSESNWETLILSYAKVIEFVSQTVIRLEIIKNALKKLNSPRVVSPDANFILELVHFFEEQRVYKKDKEATILTIQTCCDVMELKRYAPDFLKKLKEINSDSSKKEKDEALKELAISLVDTRNSIAHAKANYKPTGNECPDNQISEFITCIKKASHDSIRWFNLQKEDQRVV